MTAEGAILVVQPDADASTSATSRVFSSKTKTYAVVNGGNLAAPITLIKSGSQFSMSPNPTTTTVNAASSTILERLSFNPTSYGGQNGSITMSTTTKLCAAASGGAQAHGYG